MLYDKYWKCDFCDKGSFDWPNNPRPLNEYNSNIKHVCSKCNNRFVVPLRLGAQFDDLRFTKKQLKKLGLGK